MIAVTCSVHEGAMTNIRWPIGPPATGGAGLLAPTNTLAQMRAAQGPADNPSVARMPRLSLPGAATC